jgi:hypothetical protein
VRDAHLDIVHHSAELVGGHSRRAQENEIFEFFVGHFARAEYGVVEPRESAAGDGKPNGGGLSSGALGGFS